MTDFLLLYLIIFLVFSLAVGLPLILVIYRKRKPPSGRPKQQKPPESEEKKLAKMNCPYCGAEVREGDKFCGECGKPL